MDGSGAGALFGNTGKGAELRGRAGNDLGQVQHDAKLGQRAQEYCWGFAHSLSCTLALETAASPRAVISGENLAPSPKTLFNILMVCVSCKADE